MLRRSVAGVADPGGWIEQSLVPVGRTRPVASWMLMQHRPRSGRSHLRENIRAGACFPNRGQRPRLQPIGRKSTRDTCVTQQFRCAALPRLLVVDRLRLRRREDFLEAWIRPQRVPLPAQAKIDQG
jgi:hypothetical protein